VAEGWRRLHDEELQQILLKSQSMRLVGHVAHAWEGLNNSYKILIGKLDGKRPLEIPRRRRENNIKTDLKIQRM
jgi:hypothetical protein